MGVVYLCVSTVHLECRRKKRTQNGTHLLTDADANLGEHLVEDPVAFLLLRLAHVVLHGVVDRFAHHLLLHVHHGRLALEFLQDALDLGQVHLPRHERHGLLAGGRVNVGWSVSPISQS